MRTWPLYKGTIIGLYREKRTSVSMLAIEDEKRGKVLVPCYGTTLAKSFHEAFGGVLVGGRFKNDAIEGKLIYYRVDSLGMLAEFCPVDDKAPRELIAEYAKAAAKEPTKAGHIGFVEPDDPRIPKDQFGGPGTYTRGGFLPDDHWLYGAGPIVAGRVILESPKKKTPEK